MLAQPIALAIDGMTIRTDEQGRFCLNDLHKASGAEGKNRPSIWLANQQTKDLIGEIEKAGIPAFDSKQQVGTFVVKELVYSYAMWISPAFNLKVIRTFDAVVTGRMQPIDPMAALSDPSALRGLLLGYSEKVIVLEAENQSMRVDVQALNQLTKADGSLCITDAAKALGKGQKELHKWLSAHDWIYKRNGSTHWLGYSDKEKSGYIEHKVTEVSRPDGTAKITEQVRITPKGLAKLAKTFAAGDAT